MVAIATQAAALGFTDLGVTGGEPFMVAAMPEILARLAATLPVVALTNATLFTEARLHRQPGVPRAVEGEPADRARLGGLSGFDLAAGQVPT